MFDSVTARHVRTVVVCMNIRSRRSVGIRNDLEWKTAAMTNDVRCAIRRILLAPAAKLRTNALRCRNLAAGKVRIPMIRETMIPVDDPEILPMLEGTSVKKKDPAVPVAALMPGTEIRTTRTMQRKRTDSRLHAPGIRAITC